MAKDNGVYMGEKVKGKDGLDTRTASELIRQRFNIRIVIVLRIM